MYNELYPLYRDLYFALGEPGKNPLAGVLPTLIRIAESVHKKRSRRLKWNPRQRAALARSFTTRCARSARSRVCTHHRAIAGCCCESRTIPFQLTVQQPQC